MEGGQKSAGYIRQGRQIILQETGHGVPTEAPEAVVDAVRAVLREQ